MVRISAKTENFKRIKNSEAKKYKTELKTAP